MRGRGFRVARPYSSYIFKKKTGEGFDQASATGKLSDRDLCIASVVHLPQRSLRSNHIFLEILRETDIFTGFSRESSLQPCRCHRAPIRTLSGFSRELGGCDSQTRTARKSNHLTAEGDEHFFPQHLINRLYSAVPFGFKCSKTCVEHAQLSQVKLTPKRQHVLFLKEAESRRQFSFRRMK